MIALYHTKRINTTQILDIDKVKTIAIGLQICYYKLTSEFGHVYSNTDYPPRFKGASEFQGESATNFNFDDN